MYVWFEAVMGYYSATRLWAERSGNPDAWKDFWQDPDAETYYFQGKDNIPFHTIIWPAILLAHGGLNLPTDVVANEYLNLGGEGFSKSRGRAVWLPDYLERYDVDPLRYYLSQISLENQRATFRFDEFVTRNNNELVAALGNLVHRTMTFAHRYFNGRVPAQGALAEDDAAQLRMISALPDEVAEALEGFHFKTGIERIMAAARESNRYFDHKQPWVQRKEDMAACGTTINLMLNTVKVLATVMAPYLPFAAEKVAVMLSCGPDEMTWAQALRPLTEGRSLGEAQMLFPKLDPPEGEE